VVKNNYEELVALRKEKIDSEKVFANAYGLIVYIKCLMLRE
jgi:hypothetical protein